MDESNVRITITDEDGVILDTLTITREEFIKAQTNSMGALAVLESFSIGE